MADQIPIEKLQPCLLDRLTDDEPTVKEESRAQRVVSLQKYRLGVLRDLEWLFNSQPCLDFGDGDFSLKDYPEAFKSVINYGTRQLSGVTSPNSEHLQEELSRAIELFEPRIMAHGLAVHADIERNVLTFEIRGDLWANPVPEQLHLKSSVDLEIGQCVIGDSLHG